MNAWPPDLQLTISAFMGLKGALPLRRRRGAGADLAGAGDWEPLPFEEEEDEEWAGAA